MIGVYLVSLALRNFFGRGCVIYGKEGELQHPIDLDNLQLPEGFHITGTSSSQIGISLSFVGDVNDGRPDIFVGAYGYDKLGRTYMRFYNL